MLNFQVSSQENQISKVCFTYNGLHVDVIKLEELAGLRRRGGVTIFIVAPGRASARPRHRHHQHNSATAQQHSPNSILQASSLQQQATAAQPPRSVAPRRNIHRSCAVHIMIMIHSSNKGIKVAVD